MHKRVIKKFQRRYVYSPGIDAIWTSDLILQRYAKENNSYKYILTVMDIFSKFAWVRVTKTKDKKTIADAFEDIIKKSSRKCQFLWSDNGGEFFKKVFEDMLKRHNIMRYTTQSELKAIMAERFNQSFMNQIVKIFADRDYHRYIDDIHRLVNDYNNSYHSSIKMTPVEASKKENEGLVYYNLYNDRRRKLLKQNRKHKFTVNDRVRITRFKKTFQKGYSKRWTDEIFIVYKVNPTLPVTYKIKEIPKNGKNVYIKGDFYQEELQKTALSEK